MKNKLVVLEGTDGAGKSTQVELIKKYLDEKKLKHEFIHFPKYGDNYFSDMISKFLRGDLGKMEYVDPYFVATIYAMDRFKYKERLQQLIKDNDIVILDRYVFSNAAFQGGKYIPRNNKTDEENKSILENRKEIVNWILDFEFLYLKLPKPNLTLVFDVPLKTVEERLSQDRKGEDREYLEGKQDIHEADLDFQRNVRDVYLQIKKDMLFDKMFMYPYEIIDCEIMGELLTPKELFFSYKLYIDKLLQNE